MFDNYFEVYLADTPEGKERHYHLRYQVYCLEEKFEDPATHPLQLETDQYDDASAHFLVRSRLTGEWVAAMRLVFGLAEGLPLSTHSQVDDEYAREGSTVFAEVSRMCVLGKFRRRARGGQEPPLSGPSMGPKIINIHQEQRRQESEIMFGLIRAARTYSLRRGINNWFFFVSDPLARILRMANLRIKPAGTESYFNGKRRPYYCDLNTLLLDLSEKTPELSKLFSKEPGYQKYSLVDDADALRLAGIS